jgi:3-dehydroquinate dehydratase-1
LRLQSEIKVEVKGKVFGGEEMLICLPLVSKNQETLVEQAKELCDLNPDIIEWRVDFFDRVEDIESVVEALKALSETVGEIPIIFTCRHKGEGGQADLTQDQRINIIESSAKTGCIDILDVEMFNDDEFLEKIRNIAKGNDIKLILSHHNFTQTPDEDFIYNKLIEGEKLGADISKLAVMPQNYGDVLTLLNATYRARKVVKIPLVTMSMGEVGGITRIAGGLFGSDMSFAVGKESSAPGQVPIKDLQTILEILPQ